MPSNVENIAQQVPIKKYSFLNNLWYFFKWLMLGFGIISISVFIVICFHLFIASKSSVFQNIIGEVGIPARLQLLANRELLESLFIRNLSTAIIINYYPIFYLYYIVRKTILRNKKLINTSSNQAPFILFFCKPLAIFGTLVFLLMALVISWEADPYYYKTNHWSAITISTINAFFYSGALNAVAWRTMRATSVHLKKDVILMVIINIISLMFYLNVFLLMSPYN